MRLITVVVIVTIAAGPRLVRADDVPVTINLVGGAPAIPGAPPKVKVGDTITITCPASCNDLAVAQGVKTLKAKGVAAPSPWTSPPVGKDGATVTVGFGTLSVSLTVDGGAQDKTGGADPAATGSITGAGGATVRPSALVRPVCPESGAALLKDEIAVDTTGNVLATNVGSFSEDDTLTVWVFGPPAIVDAVRVERRSAFRDITVLRIQGDPSKVTGLIKEASEPAATVCKRTQLADFAPGRGQFALVGADGTVVAAFELAVRHVFDGTFTVAFLATWLVDRSFSLRPDGTIVEDPSSNTEGRFGLMYTAFVPTSWLADRLAFLDRRIGVSVGVLLDDPLDNLLFGVNLGPINGLSLVAGGHFGRITALDGVAVDDVLAPGATIPTENEWRTDWFIGASIDISVATRLFFAGFGQ